MVNSHWGDIVEDNSFGTHEFMDLVELLGADAYVNGNVGSGTMAEMSEWIGHSPGPTIPRWPPCAARTGAMSRGRCPSSASATRPGAAAGTCAPRTTRRWPASTPPTCATTGATQSRASPPGRATTTTPGPRRSCARPEPQHRDGKAGPYQAISMHYYTMSGPWHDKGSATEFTEEEWYLTLSRAAFAEELVGSPRDRHGPLRPAQRWAWSSTSGAPGGTSSPAPIPASCAAEHRARRPGRLAPLRRLPPPRGPPAHGEHRPDRGTWCRR